MIPAPCRRTRAWIAARRAMRLSVRVGEVLRRAVGPDGDAGQLNVAHMQALFQTDNEKAEVLRLIGMAKRWPRGRVINGENEKNQHYLGDYIGAVVSQNGE